jgi:hypothetical protein
VPFQLDEPNVSGVPYGKMVAIARKGKVAINSWNGTSTIRFSISAVAVFFLKGGERGHE